MARLDTARLVADATTLTTRVHQVQQDPAVRKAWSEVGVDALRTTRSLTSAVAETGAAWRRAG